MFERSETGSALWITGATGFVGGRLLRRLRDEERAVVAFARRPPSREAAGTVRWAPLDLARCALEPAEALAASFAELPPPSGLIHLAAMASPPECDAHPERARLVNTVGPARLFEAVFRCWPELRVLHVSSGAVYRPQPEPLCEDQDLEPVNLYGATKLQSEAVALGLRDRGHPISVVRPFNHSGAGQAPKFALPSFALRLAALERAGGGVLEVGELSAVRDFLHVDQVIEIYLEVLERAGESDLLNVCSGVGHTMRDLLDGLLERCRVEVRVEVDPSRLRGDRDANVLVGDPSRLRVLLGRVPRLDRESLLDELLDDARVRLSATSSDEETRIP